ncbi:MAG: hypothetical protein GY856_34760 [bacterium]|nr:hypothetical protein [bacterium]
MTATPRRRTRLSRYHQLAARYRIYRVDGALEVDELSAHDILRRRVLFDEVILMTRHRRRPLLMISLAALLAALFLSIGLALYYGDVPPAWGIGFFVPAGLAGLYVLGRLTVPIHVLTLYSPRSKARLEFSTERGAGEAWQELERAVAEAQESARRTSQVPVTATI